MREKIEGGQSARAQLGQIGQSMVIVKPTHENQGGRRCPDYDCEIQEFFHLSPFLHERIQEFDTRIWVAFYSSSSTGERGGESPKGMLPILDPRLEYLIDSMLFVHACTSTVANRGCAFRETLLVDDAKRIHSFVLFFRTFAAHRIFPSATRATRSPRRDIR